MYIFNIYVYGHKISDKTLNNELHDFDLSYEGLNGHEVDFPYHGNQVYGDFYSTIIGKVITDDDNNEFFIDEVKNSKESDYKDDYYEFLVEYKLFLEEGRGVEKEYDEFIDKLIYFLDNTSPQFYTVEASS